MVQSGSLDGTEQPTVSSQSQEARERGEVRAKIRAQLLGQGGGGEENGSESSKIASWNRAYDSAQSLPLLLRSRTSSRSGRGSSAELRVEAFRSLDSSRESQ